MDSSDSKESRVVKIPNVFNLEDHPELLKVAVEAGWITEQEVRTSQALKRLGVFNALSGERQYQESLHKKTGQDPISIPGELILMYIYLQKAFEIYAETFGDPGEKPTMDVIRKITAIGLRALENYGCPLRDIEGSLAARPPAHRASNWDKEPVMKEEVKEPGTPDLHEVDGANQD